MIRTLIPSLLLAAVAALPAAAGTVSFEWAHVGNAGNAGELSGAASGYPEVIVGAVPYNYAISKDRSHQRSVCGVPQRGRRDRQLRRRRPHALQHSKMGSNARGGITRSGAPGSYTYATKPNMDNKPVNYVSFFDAMRFTNWLHNGQGSGDTETGAYTIGNGINEVRSTDARFWIPSEDEWYKAAYHDASAGTAGVYFDFAIGSDNVPFVATANSVGDVSNPGPVANYFGAADWNGADGNVTTVGSAGPDSVSPYGTFDQNGNV